MSTRATIRISDGDETYFVYRHCDGYPKNVEPDILAAIELQCRLSGPETGHLVSLLLGTTYRSDARVQIYEMTPCFHGDENYRYFVKWNRETQRWELEPPERSGK